MSLRQPNIAPTPIPCVRPTANIDRKVLDEEPFLRAITLERKRSNRSQRSFLLVLVDAGHCAPSKINGKVLAQVASTLSSAVRRTDAVGWYKQHSVIGLLLTELPSRSNAAVVLGILSRLTATLRDRLMLKEFEQIGLSAHLYPDHWEYEPERRPSDQTLYPDLSSLAAQSPIDVRMKRLMDIVGSSAALVAFLPLFLAIALIIKLTSRGPVLYRQLRIGEDGKPFVVLKFRSMYANNDEGIHMQWFDGFMSSNPQRYAGKKGSAGFVKMTNDPRVTPLGRILRRTSLDELPQFINVLRGQMSLVGPRPPIPYEVNAYKAWHRGRVLGVKPGITGLWQVTGRGRVTFDEMVRLDVRYVRTWSLWNDVKILIRTPRAVFIGSGAY